MAELNLSGQQLEYDDITPKITKLKNLMGQRKDIWDNLPREKRLSILKKWQKDPIMNLAWTIYKYLYKNFFGEKFLKGSDIYDN